MNFKKTFSIVMALALTVTTAPAMNSVKAVSAPGNIELSRKIATEGMVLLENHGALPIAKGQSVALFGSGQINFQKGGGGSGNVNVDYVVNLLQGMENKAKDGKISVYKPLADAYSSYIAGGGKGEMSLTDDQVKAVATNAKTAIVTISRYSSEGSDKTAAKGDYYLSDAEAKLLNQVTSAGFEKVAVVLNIGAVIDTSWIVNYPGISVLIAWQPGMEGGNATADVLCGDANPSGKLVDTFAKSYDDYPSAANFSQYGDHVSYEEDVFVGYRYFETFDSGYSRVNYEFGYGLSYTSFEISNVNVSQEKGKIHVTAKVTNEGSVAGKEVVQTYFSAPQGKLGKPGKELAAFAKTKLIQPGKSDVLQMSFDVNDMASYDDTGKVQKSAYVLEAGNYNIYVGNSIKDAGKNGIRYTYKLDKTVVAEQLTKQLAPKKLYRRLLADGTYETLKNPTVTIAAAGAAKLEAEDFLDATQGTNYVRVESFNVNGVSGQCVSYLNYTGNYVSYDLNVEKAGTYNVVFRAANGRAAITNMLGIYVNNVQQPNVNITLPQTGDGTNKSEWYNFIDTAPVTITLPAGPCTLKLVSNGSCGNIDYITLRNTEDTTITTLNGVTSTENSAAITAAAAEVTAPTGTKIMLGNVYSDPSLMDKFIAQLTNQQLADLSGGKRAQIAGGTGGIGGLSDYGIPSAQTSDGPAGLRLSTHCTAWPVETLLACTWDVDLIQQMGIAVGTEARLNKVDIWLAPGMDIHRNPLCGRNFEYFSEDPLISGKMAAAITKGVQSQGVGVTLKHFAANEKEANRTNSDSRISERALREIYLKGFEIAVKEASPWCIMSSYNLINGTETAESYDLLTNILHGEWGYKGMVMTDWGNNSTAYKEAKAGNDVKMSSGNSSNIMSALSTGLITRAELERNIKNVLNMIMKTNVFKDKVLHPTVFKISQKENTRIKAVDHAWTSVSIGEETCNDSDGGTNPTYTNTNEWMSFNVNVQRVGVYNFYPRVAVNAANAAFDIYVDDARVGSVVQKTATGGWQNWVTASPVQITLPEGQHTIKLQFTVSGMNINWFEFEFLHGVAEE
ncbi:glycoside hydrolase family 3 C-terminal domain-containing protein [Candidatus Clostridium radicumherbarum]|uniref:Glycoside hydrolase family 3 C-terminal domain-containing protein n=1 Tax=Candidatus Clostridium radicumherbarum TaxID=3381662 RepID=A0ABW8TQI8_9CLOT